tara:strand:+ start:698 stop:907 length:210 start_codon:yes stop_codon:yes gene_type:complete
LKNELPTNIKRNKERTAGTIESGIGQQDTILHERPTRRIYQQEQEEEVRTRVVLILVSIHSIPLLTGRN